MKKLEFIKKSNPLFLLGIAHRGYWNFKVTENSLKAFKNAIDINCAFEFDIHLTKDNELVVIHDSETKRVTGKDGIIEDLTLKEIKENYRLLDGESIPTLKEVFDLNKDEVPMVIELKVYRKNYKALTTRLKKELKYIKNKKNVIFISFDPRALFYLRKEGFLRQLLLTYQKEYRYIYKFKFLADAIDVEDSYIETKKVQKYYKKHFVNVWTIERYDQLDKVIKYVDTVTFQCIDAIKVREILMEKNKNLFGIK